MVGVGLAFVAVMGLVLWFVLERKLPTHTGRAANPKQIKGEEWRLSGTVGAVYEDSFEITFADYWMLGRPFTVNLLSLETEGLTDVPVDDIELKVFPTGEGFDSEAFGRCFIGTSYKTATMHLPYQVARHLLEDLRGRPKGDRWIHIHGQRAAPKETALITHFMFQ